LISKLDIFLWKEVLRALRDEIENFQVRKIMLLHMLVESYEKERKFIMEEGYYVSK